MAEGSGESLHFPALQKSVNLFIEEQKNKQTLSKTRRDVGLLSEFLKPQQENRKIEDIQPHDKNQWFSEWVYSYCEKKRRGRLWTVKPQANFNSHLKNVKYSKSIVEDRRFEQTRKVLDARYKLLKNEGRGNRTFAAEAISDDEVSVLYESKIQGISSAEALINTVWLMNSIHLNWEAVMNIVKCAGQMWNFWGMPTGPNI